MAIRSQGFIHPATLVPSELEYAEGYRARMDILENQDETNGRNIIWGKERELRRSRLANSDLANHRK